MTFVCVCSNCRRTIEQAFLYCPWCGTKKNVSVSDSKVEEVFGELEEKQISMLEKRVCELYKKLNDLEKDFGSIVDSSD